MGFSPSSVPRRKRSHLMKGIILAGGSATRLRPASLAVSKQLMPVYDKPLIYYPLTTLMLSGIREILLISTPHDLPIYKKLFEPSLEWGITLHFAEQPNPGGLAEALLIGESFIDNEPVALILGDNLFHGSGLGRQLQDSFQNPGALIAAYHVSDPRAFGVVEFDGNGLALSLEEKPENPKSSWAVPGIYFYDETVVARTKNLSRSPRGELEITDLNRSYMNDQLLRVKTFPRGTTWLDMGTPESLLEAAQYIRTIQARQGLLVGSPEEAAWRAGWIGDQKLEALASSMKATDYGIALGKLSSEGN
jgi:glucose-1-phosphate thymidylyltransferase